MTTAIFPAAPEFHALAGRPLAAVTGPPSLVLDRRVQHGQPDRGLAEFVGRRFHGIDRERRQAARQPTAPVTAGRDVPLIGM